MSWDEAWVNCPHATYFQSREWAEIWEVYGGMHPDPQVHKAIFIPFSIRNDGVRLSSPASTYGGPLSDKSLSLKRFAPVTWTVNPFAPPVKVPRSARPNHTSYLDLKEPLILSHGRKSDLNKALREGVSVRQAITRLDWENYFEVYQDSLRRWGDRVSSRYEWRLFEEMCRRDSANIKLYLAELEGKILAGALCLCGPKHVGWWHGAFKESRKEPKPATLLIVKAIEDAKTCGFQWFDFLPSGGHKGVERFKGGFRPKTAACPSIWIAHRSQLRRVARRIKRAIPRRKLRIGPLPPVLMVESVTGCNLRCLHCPSSKLFPETKVMAWPLFKKVIDEVARVAPATKVKLFNGGEPLTHPEMIVSMVDCARRCGLSTVSLTTNGTLLTPALSQLLVNDARINQIEVSIDAHSPNTFLAIKGVDLYDIVKENVRALARLRPKVRVVVSFVEQPLNAHETQAFRVYWREWVDHVAIRQRHGHGQFAVCEVSPQPDRRPPCPWPWQRMIVHRDGQVSFCEHDWLGEYPVGDAEEENLTEIWRSPRYEFIRKAHLRHRLSDVGVCEECRDWHLI